MADLITPDFLDIDTPSKGDGVAVVAEVGLELLVGKEVETRVGLLRLAVLGEGDKLATSGQTWLR